jgi:hypothetical protein
MSFSDSRATTSRSPIQLAAMVVGAVFLLVGVLGFVPGITTNVGDLTIAGHTSHAELLGIFQVSVLHNVVHLLFGVLGIAAARKFSTSRTYLIAGGAVYLVLMVYGLVTDHSSDANFVPLNDADNWLHLVLGLGMIALGFVLSRDRAATYADTRH